MARYVLGYAMETLKSPPRPTVLDDIVIPLKERKTMATLLPNHCRWPTGDPQLPDFHYCGKPKLAGHSYCDFHVRRAFSPARRRPIQYRII
ncbi:GcrA family cell cycle regulator [Hyphomicrobium sp. NDB2Meth4]|uniref:GcrA family cell cycle regulator n=1 Tax=Hyphomicrobium sp. NDB2Meth4 TaxID=1892846 RepID=UPI002452903E|nr:GcrA family cell cycle regulator [Hyphomicrobium sp. NDB2Meth4]